MSFSVVTGSCAPVGTGGTVKDPGRGRQPVGCGHIVVDPRQAGRSV